MTESMLLIAGVPVGTLLLPLLMGRLEQGLDAPARRHRRGAAERS